MLPKKLHVSYKVIREAVLLNNSTCAICKLARATEVHHIIPRDYGGSDCPMNLLPVCKDCHKELHKQLKSLIKSKIQEAAEQVIRERMGSELDKEPVKWHKRIDVERGKSWSPGPEPGDIGYGYPDDS